MRLWENVDLPTPGVPTRMMVMGSEGVGGRLRVVEGSMNKSTLGGEKVCFSCFQRRILHLIGRDFSP